MRLFWGFLGVLFIVSSIAKAEFGVVAPQLSPEQLRQLRDQFLAPELRRTPGQATSERFRSKIISLEQWASQIQSSGTEVLCVGDSHKKEYRTFFANQVLPVLRAQTLTLEATEFDAARLVEAALRGEEVSWLGAPLGEVVRKAKESIASVEFLGVEPNQEQKNAELQESLAAPHDRQLSRDGFIARNFLKQYKPRGLNVILYGSNHCSRNDVALFDRTLMKRLQLALEGRVKSVLLLPRSDRQHPLVAYMSTLSLPEGTWVLEDLAQLDSGAFNDRFEVMKIQQNFDTVVYFKDR